jgi:hypothetical protein
MMAPPRFELGTTRLSVEHSTRLSYGAVDASDPIKNLRFFKGSSANASDQTRTGDLAVNSRTLYLLSYGGIA